MVGKSKARAMVSVLPLKLALAATTYDYKDIVPTYCHTTKDWGPLPSKPDGATELIQVHAFIRHGARTQCGSDQCWEGDDVGQWTCELHYLENSVTKTQPLTQSFRTKYIDGRNGIAGNCMTGQLVKDGFEMEHNNGQRLRETYVEREQFLPQTLAGLDVHSATELLSFRSTDVPRTKQSGMSLFSGLYPPSTMGTVPYVELYTMDISQESMLINPVVCPSMAAVGSNYVEKHKETIMAQCAKLLPQRKFEKLMDCYAFLGHSIDCLMSRMCPTVPFSSHNTTVPKHFLADDAADFIAFWKLVDEIQWGYFQATTQAGGYAKFTEDFYRPAEKAVKAALGDSSEQNPKFMLWSGHDTGPMEPLYAAFDLRKSGPYWPSFASMVVLEFWKTSSGVIARWISNSEVVATMPWADFQRKAESVIHSGEQCHTSLLQTVAGSSSLRSPVTAELGHENRWADGSAMPLQGVALIACASAASAALMTWGLVTILQSSRKQLRYEDAASDSTTLSYH